MWFLILTDKCENYCENDGSCEKDDSGNPLCKCLGSFTGRTCADKSEFAYIVGGIAGAVILVIFVVLIIWMICVRTSRRKEPKNKGLMAPPAANLDPAGSGAVNFYYGSPAPYAESIAPSHHSTYAHYYDDEEDAWEMPNFYNETYLKGRLFLCISRRGVARALK